MNTLSGFSHVALTVTDMQVSRRFYADVLGLPVLDSSETYCALLTGSADLSALILTTHADTSSKPFSEFQVGLDHVSFALADEAALGFWQDRLREQAVPFEARRSEWGHHVNFRDPDNIAIEMVLVRPDAEVQAMLDDQNAHAADRASASVGRPERGGQGAGEPAGVP
ncbi:MAG: VOC family protein [Egibacteraceae bacterium]